MNDIAIIYDLDETILSDSTLPDAAFEPLKEALRKANQGTVPDDDLEQALAEIKRTAIDVLSKKYGFNEKMNKAAKEVQCKTDYHFELSPFKDYEVIKEIKGFKILVTSGVVNLQQAKIDALGIEGDFDEVIIDDLYKKNRPGKKEIFSHIAEKYKLKPAQIWIVGDNPAAEISAGNELGMVTVLRLNPGAAPSNKATHTITSFYDLQKLVEKYS